MKDMSLNTWVHPKRNKHGKRWLLREQKTVTTIQEAIDETNRDYDWFTLRQGLPVSFDLRYTRMIDSGARTNG